MPCWQRVGITTEKCCVGCSNGAEGIDLPRNLAHERALTAVAAAGARSHGGRLTALAEERALPGPILAALSRDFIQESREEAADWRNYLCWQIRQLDETRRQDLAARAARAALMETLGAVSVAYDQLMVAASLLAITPEAT
jgi:hypothetical protein